MFASFSQRFSSPQAHIERLVTQVGDDLRKRAAKVDPSYLEDFAPLLDFSCTFLIEILGTSSRSAPQAPVPTWDRKAISKNDIAGLLHGSFCTFLAMMHRQHPNRAQSLAMGLSACFAGTGNATAPYDLARKTLEQKGTNTLHINLRDAVIRSLRRCGLSGERQESAAGQRLSLITAYIEPQLRRLYPGTETAIR